jgi:hypothetical protein
MGVRVATATGTTTYYMWKTSAERREMRVRVATATGITIYYL